MTKSELYQALKQDGAKLEKPYVKYSIAELQSIYNERFGVTSGATETTVTPPEIHTLVFRNGGWCNELNRSYEAGYYRPQNMEEYLALRKYALKEL